MGIGSRSREKYNLVDVISPRNPSCVGCATLVTERNAEGDRGGNLFKIKLPAGEGKTKSSNLHSYWDGGIGGFAERDLA